MDQNSTQEKTVKLYWCYETALEPLPETPLTKELHKASTACWFLTLLSLYPHMGRSPADTNSDSVRVERQICIMWTLISRGRTLPQGLFFLINEPLLKFIVVKVWWLGLIFAWKLYQLCAPDLQAILLKTWMLIQARNTSMRRIKSCSTWPWMFPGVGHPPLLWAICATVLPPLF